MQKYRWAHENEIDLNVIIEWSKPVSFQELFDRNVDEEKAYYYSIIGKIENCWKSFYIGKVYSQSGSARHKNNDHKERRNSLSKEYPKVDWQLTLGTPKFNETGRVNEDRIDIVEGLLIYSHWHDEILNASKVNYFRSDKSIRIENRGFAKPFKKHVAYGVMTS